MSRLPAPLHAGPYTISWDAERGPHYARERGQALLAEEFALDSAQPHAVGVLRVEAENSPGLRLLVTQGYSPTPDSAFYPAFLLVPETAVLFIGAGNRVLVYDLSVPRRLGEERLAVGFWGWQRHGAHVLMSAELELAAWSLEGAKRWSVPVEPPWSYSVVDEQVHLEVMGQNRSFSILNCG